MAENARKCDEAACAGPAGGVAKYEVVVTPAARHPSQTAQPYHFTSAINRLPYSSAGLFAGSADGFTWRLFADSC